MKKFIFFAALMCCTVSLAAQQISDDPEALRIQQLNRFNNSYTVKLDSLTTGWARCLYEYDAQFHCTRQTEYCYGTIGWYVCFSREYTYDDLDRVTSIRSYDDGAVKITEYTYNEQSLLSEAIQSYFNGTNWHFQNKYDYEYDEEGNQTLFIEYEYDDDHWVEKEKKVWEYEDGLPQSMLRYLVDYAFEKTFYSYNAQGLCDEMTRCYRNTEPGWTMEWGAYYKERYEYDDAGNLLSRVSLLPRTNSDEWYYNEKTELAYDENNNCTYIGIYSGYDYDTGQWINLKNALDFTFDRTVSIDNIAGFLLFWEHWLDDFNLNVPVFNELQHVTSDNLGQINQWDFYYSNFNSLDEPAEDVFAIFPNPTDNILDVETGRGMSLPDQSYHITNMIGQALMTGIITAENHRIDVSDLPQGMYFITVGDATRKFVVR